MSKFESSPVVTEFLRQNNTLFPDRDLSVIAGVSGGPDSMSLLYILHRLDIQTIAVHCNYQMRGKYSEQDQQLVEKMCALWEIECVALRFNPDETGAENFQQWARKRRYQVFRDLLQQNNSDLILTAHHQDDQLETILQRILRGAGTSAWRGIQVLEDDLYRPLLRVPKSEIMKFVQQFNIPCRIDGSNEESTYARNFLRLNWFPHLERLFPGWRNNLLKVPERSREFSEMAEFILTSVADEKNGLKRKEFLSLSPALQRVTLHHWIQIEYSQTTLTAGAFSQLDDLKQLQTGKSLQLEEELFLTRERNRFILTKPDETESRFSEIRITRDEIRKGEAKGQLVLAIESGLKEFKPHTLYLDPDTLIFPLSIREWLPGDKIQPLGMSGSQLVSDHLTNRKVEASLKKQAKVIESFDGRICAIIFPHLLEDGQIGTVAEPNKCTEATKQSLIIRKQ